MIRRPLSALVVVAAALTGVLVGGPSQAATPATAPAATSGGTCTLRLPSRISVNDLFVFKVAQASGTCTTTEAQALWSTDGLATAEDDFDFPGGIAAYARGHNAYGPGAASYGPYGITLVFGDEVHWGVNTFKPEYAGRGCNDEGRCKVTYVQNSPTSDVRLATRSLLRATRHGDVVHLQGRGKVFAPYRWGWKGRIFNASFQSRPASGGAWTTLREVKTGFKGFAEMNVRKARGTQYRFVTRSDAHWWTSVSRSVTR